MQELDRRVTHLEFKVEGHERKIDAVERNTAELTATLKAIQDTLKQIKWLIVGGAAATVFHYSGLGKTLTLLGFFV
jgi:hypothetical protein